MEKNELEQYYESDESWNGFVDFHAKHWEKCTFKDSLVSSLNNNIDIAKVIFGVLCNEGFFWIDSAAPALDGLKPIDCIFDENLKKRLKVVLTRMPV